MYSITVVMQSTHKLLNKTTSTIPHSSLLWINKCHHYRRFTQHGTHNDIFLLQKNTELPKDRAASAQDVNVQYALLHAECMMMHLLKSMLLLINAPVKLLDISYVPLSIKPSIYR